MSEVDNIGKISELLSNKIFKNFGWSQTGGWNINWGCEKLQQHNKEKVKTHPADVVFHYADPYSGKNIYLHTDLKSYGKSTIDSMNLESILKSLCHQIDCAEISNEWKENFLIKNKSFEIHGLLFIYNHDQDAEYDFTSKLASLNTKNIEIPQDKKIYILTPKEIGWITDVSAQISTLKGDNEIKSDFAFFYPQRTFRAIDQYQSIATIELLKSNFIILKSSRTAKIDDLKIFYKGLGETENEFQYFLDYLRHHQFLDYTENTIKVYFHDDCHKNAVNNFKNSKINYIKNFITTESDFSTNIRGSIENIKYESLTHVDNSKTYKEHIVSLGER